jgi:hypothetical protein
MTKTNQEAKANGKPPIVGEVSKKIKRETFKSDNFFSVYVNDVQVQTSVWDMRLILGEIETSDKHLTRIKELGELRISPQLAKKLTVIMQQMIKGYEQNIGEIPTQKD